MLQHNPGWLSLLNLATFVWISGWTVHSVALAIRGYRPSVIGPMVAVFAFNGLPLLLDEIIGRPSYPANPGFAIGSRDPLSSSIYCFYVFLIPPILWSVGRTSQQKKQLKELFKGNLCWDKKDSTPSWLITLLYGIVVAPLFLLLLSPSPGTYLQFGWKESWRWGEHNLTDSVLNFAPWLARAALLSIVSSSMIVIVKRKLSSIDYLSICSLIAVDIIVIGMRYAFAYACALAVFSFWHRGSLRNLQLITASILAVIVVAWYSDVFLRDYRLVQLQSFEEQYTRFRIEYGRDDVVKMTIYAELYPERMQILEYRGQSLLYDLLIAVPRAIWQEKPREYSYYFSSAMILTDPDRFPFEKGYMTTSWLDEAIANFSWMGFFIGPLVPALICRIGDTRSKMGIAYALTFLTSCLFLAVHLPAFYPVFALWVLVVVFSL